MKPIHLILRLKQTPPDSQLAQPNPFCILLDDPRDGQDLTPMEGSDQIGCEGIKASENLPPNAAEGRYHPRGEFGWGTRAELSGDGLGILGAERWAMINPPTTAGCGWRSRRRGTASRRSVTCTPGKLGAGGCAGRRRAATTTSLVIPEEAINYVIATAPDHQI